MNTDIADNDEMSDLQVRLKYKKSEKDDWTKIEDKALRKKIQNRLAKRKSRMSHCTTFFLSCELLTDSPIRIQWPKGQDKETA